jgi:hypothetical protein
MKDAMAEKVFSKLWRKSPLGIMEAAAKGGPMLCPDCKYKRPGKLRKMPNRLVYKCMKCRQCYGFLAARLAGRMRDRK